MKTDKPNSKFFDSPIWHGLILKDRNIAVVSGKAMIIEWNEAKIRIRKHYSKRIRKNQQAHG